MKRITYILVLGGLMLMGACQSKQSKKMDTACSAKIVPKT